MVGLIAVLAIMAGIVSVIWPLRPLRIETRRTGLLVLLGGFATLVISGLILPDTPEFQTEDTTATPSSTTVASSTTSSSTSTTTTTIATTTTHLASTTTQPETTTTTAGPTTTTTTRTQQSEITAVITQTLGDSLLETEVIEQFDGGYGVMIRMNVSDNLTMNMIAGGFELDAGEMMLALYRDNRQLDVRWVDITGLFPLTDEFGNTEPGEVVTVHFIEEEADKVNWSTDESTLKLDILPGLYEWHFIHPELQEHLP
jgi:hypothetical protein